MVIICLNQRMPKVTVRSVFHGVQQFQCRIDRLTKLSHYYKFIQLKVFLLVCISAVADYFITIHLYDSINVANISGLQRDLGTNTNRHIVEWCAFRQMFLEYEPELFLFHQFIGFLQNPVPECGIADLPDQVL